MRSKRLERLAQLTRGAALVGLGITEAGCAKEPMEPIHINAPPDPQPTSAPIATTSAPTATVATSDPTSAIPSAAPLPKYVNSPPPGPDVQPKPLPTTTATMAPKPPNVNSPPKRP